MYIRLSLCITKNDTCFSSVHRAHRVVDNFHKMYTLGKIKSIDQVVCFFVACINAFSEIFLKLYFLVDLINFFCDQRHLLIGLHTIIFKIFTSIYYRELSTI